MGVLPTDAQVSQHLKASLAFLNLPWRRLGGLGTAISLDSRDVSSSTISTTDLLNRF